MHGYDVTLKDLLMDGAPALMTQLAGRPTGAVLPTELPAVVAGRLDLFGRLEGDDHLHVELQATNLATIGIRMMGYQWLVLRERPDLRLHQTVLYVGFDPMSMPSVLTGPMFEFRIRAIDIRDLDAAPLLASDAPSDLVLALLVGADDLRGRVAAVMRRLAELLSADPEKLSRALASLLLLAPLRKAVPLVEEEMVTMPITIDLETHPFASRFFLKGKAEGEAAGQAALFAKILRRRFGPLSEGTIARIGRATAVEIDAWTDRVFDAASLAAIDPALDIRGPMEAAVTDGRNGEERGPPQAAVLLRLLRRAFGALPDVIEERVRDAPPEKIDAWIDRLVDGLPLDDLIIQI